MQNGHMGRNRRSTFMYPGKSKDLSHFGHLGRCKLSPLSLLPKYLLFFLALRRAIPGFTRPPSHNSDSVAADQAPNRSHSLSAVGKQGRHGHNLRACRRSERQPIPARIQRQGSHPHRRQTIHRRKSLAQSCERRPNAVVGLA